MRSLIRSLVINLASLYFLSRIISGVKFTHGLQGILVTSLILIFLNRLIKPIINLILLPINLITLGTFRWITNVAVLYIVSLLSPHFTLTGFYLGHLFLGPFITLVVASFLLSLIQSTLRWLLG